MAAKRRPSLIEALVLVGPALPLLAAFLVVAIYAMPQDSVLAQLAPALMQHPLITGTVLAAVTGLLGACLFVVAARAWTAAEWNAEAVSEIRMHLADLDVHVESTTDAGNRSPSALAAYQRMVAHRQQIEDELRRAGSGWVRASSYLAIWRLIHRAEEELLMVRPPVEVVAAALYDTGRLLNSSVPNQEVLQARLRDAVLSLDPTTARYFDAAPNANIADLWPAELARVVVVEVRRTINEFREERHAGILRLRSELSAVFAVTGVLTYLLASLAIGTRGLAHASAPLSADPIVVASVLFIVGAMASLFNQLSTDAGDDLRVDDHGVRAWRVAFIPLLGGLSALFAPLLLAIVATTVNPVVGPIGLDPTVTSGAETSTPGVQPRIEDIYNLQASQYSIVVAALAGVAANVLVGNGLVRRVVVYQRDLGTSQFDRS